MSNIVSVQFTRFQNLDGQGHPDGESTFGYRIFDDYGQNYNNCFASVDEMRDAGLTREGIFDFIAENHDDFDLTAREKGVYLNGDWIAPPKDGDTDGMSDLSDAPDAEQ